MNNNHMGRDKVIDSIVELILRLSDELEKIKDQVNPHDLWPLHPTRNVIPPFEKAKPIMNEIIEIVMDQNGQMLSEDVIFTNLLYQVAAERMKSEISDEQLRKRANTTVENLINYRSERLVDVPLYSLKVGDKPFTFGPVTFFPITDHDKQDDWWITARYSFGDSINEYLLSYARVSVIGTNYKSVKNATILVNEALLLLRGIGFPISIQEINQFGIINDYPIWKVVPYRLGDPKEEVKIEPSTHGITTIGPSHLPYHLEEILNYKKENIGLLLSIISENGFSSENEIEARILSGFRWLGEATKPDALAARFAKTAFSLEAFIGGEVKDENLMTRGITAALAERAAFLVGDSQETRYEVHKQIIKYYGMRSGITHGRTNKIIAQDFERFGQLVREIGWSLVNKIDQFNSLDNLQKWIISQRYSMGDVG